MSELFSHERLVDYFTTFDLEVIGLNESVEKVERINRIDGIEDYTPIKIQYKHRKLSMYPKKIYKEKSLYELNMDSIFQMLPTEQIYLRKPNNKYFSMIFTNADGNHYYGFFLKIFKEINKDHTIYKDLSTDDLFFYYPRYLCLVSFQPYFVSFKYILEEIYSQSTLNENKCYKVENILSSLLYRIYMPKYETTQLCWTLNDKVYLFTKNKFKLEVSYKLLFSYISIEKVVLLYTAFLMGSIIIFFHSNIEIVAPIVHLFMQLLFPFSAGFSIITNLNPMMKEYLACPSSNIIIGLNTADFDMNEVISLIRGSNANIVYCDIDENKLIIDNNEDMKSIDLLPRQRINTLIDNLCKIAEIYEKDKIRFNNMKKNDIWDMFQSTNHFSLNENNPINKFKSRESIMISNKNGSLNFNKLASKKSITIKENFSNEDIRSLFFDFNLSLFEAYDENTQYEINNETHDVTFLPDKFIDASKSDIRKFLQYVLELPIFDILLQNYTHIVDQRYKNDLKKNDPKFYKTEFKMNPSLREAALSVDFDKTYEIIKYGLERRKKNKSLNKLLMTKIYNTISIPSPKFEKLPYLQENIFDDAMHEETVFHESSVPLDKLKFDFTDMNLDLKEQNDLNKNLLRNEMIYLNQKEEDTQRKKETGKVVKDKKIMSIIKEINTENRINPITIVFKEYLSSNKELVKMYYGFILSKLKKLINMKNDENLHTKNEEKSADANLSNSLNYTSNIIKTFTNFKKDAIQSLVHKEEYIKNFNFFYDTYIKNKTNPMVEFNFNFCVNLVQSISFCEFCNKPNSIWDIRKEFVFSKSKRESKTKCKFCEKHFVPYFYILEEENEEKLQDVKNKKMKKNSSFDNNRLDTSVSADYRNDLISNKDILDKSNKIKRVEYMSFEHMMIVLSEFETEEKFSNKIKKFPYNLFYNFCLLLGEFKIRIDQNNKIEIFNLENYLKRHLSKHQNELGEHLITSSSKQTSSNDVLKIFRDNYIKKLKEIEDAKLKKKTTTFTFHKNHKEKIPEKDKIVNIKFDMKDLMDEEKYKLFEKDLKLLPNFNKNNMKKITNFMRESKITLKRDRISTAISPFKFSTASNNQNNLRMSNPFAKFNSPDTYREFIFEDNMRYSNNYDRANEKMMTPTKSRSKSSLNRFSIDIVSKSKHFQYMSKSRSKSRKNKLKIKENLSSKYNLDNDANLLKKNLIMNNNPNANNRYKNLLNNLHDSIDSEKKENDLNNYVDKNKNQRRSALKETNSFLKMFDQITKNKLTKIKNSKNKQNLYEG